MNPPGTRRNFISVFGLMTALPAFARKKQNDEDLPSSLTQEQKEAFMRHALYVLTAAKQTDKAGHKGDISEFMLIISTQGTDALQILSSTYRYKVFRDPEGVQATFHFSRPAKVPNGEYEVGKWCEFFTRHGIHYNKDTDSARTFEFESDFTFMPAEMESAIKKLKSPEWEEARKKAQAAVEALPDPLPPRGSLAALGHQVVPAASAAEKTRKKVK